MILIDTNEQAIDEILKGVELLIDKKIKEANFDKTEKGQIITVNSDGTYTVKINGMEYSKIKSNGGSFEINNIVSIIIPKNNYNLMYIDEMFMSDEDKEYIEDLKTEINVDDGGNIVISKDLIVDGLSVSKIFTEYSSISSGSNIITLPMDNGIYQIYIARTSGSHAILAYVTTTSTGICALNTIYNTTETSSNIGVAIDGFNVIISATTAARYCIQKIT